MNLKNSKKSYNLKWIDLIYSVHSVAYREANKEMVRYACYIIRSSTVRFHFVPQRRMMKKIIGDSIGSHFPYISLACGRTLLPSVHAFADIYACIIHGPYTIAKLLETVGTLSPLARARRVVTSHRSPSPDARLVRSFPLQSASSVPPRRSQSRSKYPD
jgi:hypothetical protein